MNDKGLEVGVAVGGGGGPSTTLCGPSITLFCKIQKALEREHPRRTVTQEQFNAMIAKIRDLELWYAALPQESKEERKK